MSSSIRNVTHVSAGAMMATGAAPAQGAAPPAGSAPAPAADRPTVVLVHGAFADGSAWARVIPLLERDGYPVVAVQNPLTAFDADVANTRRVIAARH
jgi:pimeloyl-ACP methyl ester carboxylesterase